MNHRRELVVVGNGMVGHRFLEELIERRGHQAWNITVFGEEPHPAYDRVHLSEYFAGRSAEDLYLGPPDLYREHGVRLIKGDAVTRIDQAARMVHSSKGRVIAYDALVLATGSRPFVPPVRGSDGPGCFVYRTIEDLDRIRAFAARRRTGVVIGGGLLGLEAASALRNMGLETHVVEIASHLMAVQLDEVGGRMLQSRIEEMGIHVHTSKRTVEILFAQPELDQVPPARAQMLPRRGPERLRFGDGSELDTDVVIFSAGIRPRDELARESGLAIGDRGGIMIDDHCRSSAATIYAIGECASWRGKTYGLIGPGYKMATVAASHISGDYDTVFRGPDPATELKLLDVPVATFGDSHGRTPGALSLAISDQVSHTYKKLTVSADRKRLLGAILVGDTGNYRTLLQMAKAEELPPNPEILLIDSAILADSALSAAGSAMDTQAASHLPICTCNDVSGAQVCQAIRDGAHDVAAIKQCTKAGSGCGGCVPAVTDLLHKQLSELGVDVSDHVCEHFAYSRQDLYALIQVKQIKTFEALIDGYGRGRGCEICKPAVASILAACWNEHILDPAHAPLQDSNDYFLANIQKDGTYSIVPRVPGGEITPDGLIAIGQIAKKYDLYTKITGGQRIDLFGAQVDQLPDIWAELVAAGFESGHAYGKAMRTVKSCVGSTWCRYGVQDSVGVAIRLEKRYRGLRAPHKLKLAVSGCTRECAEAQSKDIGVIATENGYNLYVAGNGGAKPRHAELLATDLDEETLVRYIDRFLMFYIRTADRLQRTARWIEQLEGGLDYVKEVVIADRLGIAADLEAQMAYLVSTYECEWKAVLADQEKLERFHTFVNRSGIDVGLEYVRERGQRRPARPDEIAAIQALEASS